MDEEEQERTAIGSLAQPRRIPKHELDSLLDDAPPTQKLNAVERSAFDARRIEAAVAKSFSPADAETPVLAPPIAPLPSELVVAFEDAPDSLGSLTRLDAPAMRKMPVADSSNVRSTISFLGRHTQLQRLPLNELKVVFSRLTTLDIRAGKVVFDVGAECGAIYFLEAGVAELVSVSSEGLETKEFARIGAAFGVVEAALESPHRTRLRILENARLLTMDVDSFRELYKSLDGFRAFVDENVRGHVEAAPPLARGARKDRIFIPVRPVQRPSLTRIWQVFALIAAAALFAASIKTLLR